MQSSNTMVNICHQSVNILLFAKDVVILVSESADSAFSINLPIRVHSVFPQAISLIGKTIPSCVRPLRPH
uniref:Uncharacterized protein n=1 Tax=Anguilla anguilla TaxID=7936 RepID=A0A0E9RBZ8_ANGAN